jgi:XTP/dITP diphosphohydrolase
MNKILFCTSNSQKFREAEFILGFPLEHSNIDLAELQGMDLKKIVEHKTKQAWEILRRPVLVEDVGLYVNAWKGFPGPFVKWAQNSMGYQAIADALPRNNRRAEWVVVYGLCINGKVYLATGKTKGLISAKKLGQSAFGFDPWFIATGEKKSYAQMSPTEKTKTSARAKALRKLKKRLSQIRLV